MPTKAPTRAKDPWRKPMPLAQFQRMLDLIHAPSPVGLEGAMKAVALAQIQEFMPDTWKIHHFGGSAGFVIDTMPEAGPDVLTVMAIGHMDKIRLVVRAVDKSGRIWVNSDSILPFTAIGHRVILYSEDPKVPGSWREIRGGVIGSHGAVHLAPVNFRDGAAGPKKDDLYLELHLRGDDVLAQVNALGIRPGDVMIFDSPVRRGVGPNTISGAYLDNALGCHGVLEVLFLLAANPIQKVRYLCGCATHEEIGMMGGVLLAHRFSPHIVIGVDVNHDFSGTAHQAAKNNPPIGMGNGVTIATGSVCTPNLVTLLQRVAQDQKIPYQLDPVGRITGTDAMAGWMAGVDAVTTSLGIPVIDMHTPVEAGNTKDVMALIYLLDGLLRRLDFEEVTPAHFHMAHPNLSLADEHGWVKPKSAAKKGAAKN